MGRARQSDRALRRAGSTGKALDHSSRLGVISVRGAAAQPDGQERQHGGDHIS